MRIYLDNCCFNRPYDDQSHLEISLETQAKLYVQDMIRNGKMELVSSFMLTYENSQNPYDIRRNSIGRFVEQNTSIYVDESMEKEISEKVEEIKQTGVKYKDACHVACAILAGCDCFLTTDYRLLKYQTTEIKMMNPMDFIKFVEEE